MRKSDLAIFLILAGYGYWVTSGPLLHRLVMAFLVGTLLPLLAYLAFFLICWGAS